MNGAGEASGRGGKGRRRSGQSRVLGQDSGEFGAGLDPVVGRTKGGRGTGWKRDGQAGGPLRLGINKRGSGGGPIRGGSVEYSLWG
jgi:hypothetical protein